MRLRLAELVQVLQCFATACLHGVAGAADEVIGTSLALGGCARLARASYSRLYSPAHAQYRRPNSHKLRAQCMSLYSRALACVDLH